MTSAFKEAKRRGIPIDKRMPLAVKRVGGVGWGKGET
jgi:hypothetical protein